MPRILTLLLAVTLLAACSGGGGSSSTVSPVTDSGSGSVDNAPSVTEWTARPLSTERRGVGRSQLVSYLKSVVEDVPFDPVDFTLGGPRMWRMNAPAVARIVGNTTPAQRGILVDALQIVNAVLPGAQRVRLGDPLPEGTMVESTPSGVIAVEFTPNVYCGEGGCTGVAMGTLFDDIDRIHIQYDSSAPIVTSSVSAMAHELLHALGIWGHSEDPNSIMHATVLSNTMPVPNALERDAILALYTAEDGTEVDSLGPWAADASVYGATFRPDRGISIGLDVEARNGFAVATIMTDAQRMAPADTNLSGTATWNGQAYGLTDDAMTLHGDADLILSLSALTGSLGLTDFDGYRDLSFNVRWAQDGLIRTGGDAGAVDGWLYGNGGEYAAGTAHTSDAAFAWAGERP